MSQNKIGGDRIKLLFMASKKRKIMDSNLFLGPDPSIVSLGHSVDFYKLRSYFDTSSTSERDLQFSNIQELFIWEHPVFTIINH